MTTAKSKRLVAYYSALKIPDPKSLTPQGCAIVRVLAAHGGPMTRKELVAALGREITGSKQLPTRVVAFYKKGLLASGFISVEKRLPPTL